MSRIGKMPIDILDGIEVSVEGNTVHVKSGKKVLSQIVHRDMKVRIENKKIIVSRPGDSQELKALHGLTRSLINNMIIGVSKGFTKNLEINGVGYKAQKAGNKLILNLGYSHTIEMVEPDGITFEVPAPNRIVVSGADKQLVGEMAAKIRACRLPDAYKGKGIKYDFEILRLKEGKTGAKGGPATGKGAVKK
jgi:large subunit ribosomal protein L6